MMRVSSLRNPVERTDDRRKNSRLSRLVKYRGRRREIARIRRTQYKSQGDTGIVAKCGITRPIIYAACCSFRANFLEELNPIDGDIL